MNTVYGVICNAGNRSSSVTSEFVKGCRKKTSAGKIAVMALAFAMIGTGAPAAYADETADDIETSCEANESEADIACSPATSSNTDGPTPLTQRYAAAAVADGGSGGSTLRNAIGTGVTVAADNSTGIGSNLTVDAANSIAIGSDYNQGGGNVAPAINAGSAGSFVVSPNGNASAGNAPNSVAILGHTAGASGGIDIGYNSWVYNGNGIAIGQSSLVYYGNSVAIGAGAITFGQNSVALGASSANASRANVIAVGNTTAQRQIINMAAGTANTDAVNVSQILSVVDGLGATFDVSTGTITGPTFTVQGTSETNVANAVTSLDNAVTAHNHLITALDGRVATAEDDITNIKATVGDLQAGVSNGIAYDDNSRAVVTFGGATGTLLTNVANGQIAAGSKDAINGGQLSDIRDQLQNQIGDLGDRVDDVESAIAEGASGGSGGAGSDNDAGGNPISNVGNGVADSDAVNVGQLSEHTQQAINTANSYTDSKFQLLSDTLNSFKSEVNDRFNQQDIRINRMGAMSAAMSQMAFSTQGIATPNRVGVGVGTQGGQAAIAVGYSRSISKNVNVSLGGSASGSEVSAGAGVGIGW